jgi:hypothetical protein
MTFGAPAEERLPLRAVLGLFTAAFGLAACLTLVWLGMRGVMDIGGACADGGPYVSAQPCPDGVPLLMTLGIFGLFGFGALGFWAGAIVGGGWVGLPLLAWPALFLSLGWNFLEYGVNPPESFGEGPELGWLIPGVLFVLMGGVPLLVAWRARDAIRADGKAGVAVRFGAPSFGSVRRAASVVTVGSRPRDESEGRTSGPVAAAAVTGTDHGDIVDRLERLARLRRSGDLTNSEYDAAKAALLADTSAES